MRTRLTRTVVIEEAAGVNDELPETDVFCMHQHGLHRKITFARLSLRCVVQENANIFLELSFITYGGDILSGCEYQVDSDNLKQRLQQKLEIYDLMLNKTELQPSDTLPQAKIVFVVTGKYPFSIIMFAHELLNHFGVTSSSPALKASFKVCEEVLVDVEGNRWVDGDVYLKELMHLPVAH